MRTKFILIIIIGVCCTNIVFSQNSQGIKKSSQYTIEKIRKHYESQNFVIGGLSTGNPMSIYGMVGYMKKWGILFKVKSNFNFNSSYDEMIDDYNPNIFATKTRKGRYSFTLDVMKRINEPLSLYLGGGKGGRWLNWETDEGTSYRMKNYSFSGLEIETGAIYKYNDLFFNLGLQTNFVGINDGKGQVEICLGVGTSFSNLSKLIKKK